jgi:hypothetical protein
VTRHLVLASRALLLAVCIASSTAASAQEPLVIREQGSFVAGGTVSSAPGRFDPRKPLDPSGQSFHGDHVYAFYQVPLDAFMPLTRIPILVIYGDNIPEQPMDLPAQDSWRARLQMARLWRDAVNRHGGSVTLVHLPEVGIHGNTHFAFSDRNNTEIADLVSKFLTDKGLD